MSAEKVRETQGRNRKMKHLTTVLILALVSTNASKFLRAEQHEFQQEPREAPYLAIALDEEQFAPLVEEAAAKWESPLDGRMVLFSDLDSLENFLQEDPNDLRIKRTKTSLSIDNPLDVLREQYFRALQRRMKYKSIEKNREHLLKTGKRSGKEVPFPINLTKQQDFPAQKVFTEAGPEGSSSSSNSNSNSNSNHNPTTRRYQNRFNDLSFQT